MSFTLEKSMEILNATPGVLDAFLGNLSSDWLHANEGENSWSPLEVVHHLVIAEKFNWIQRMEIILSDQPTRSFAVFKRMEQRPTSQTLRELLDEFSHLRAQNLAVLTSKYLTAKDFDKTAFHPEFGEVNLLQLLATWTAHDLSHIGQISRVLAKHYKSAVGPWTAYLRIMGD